MVNQIRRTVVRRGTTAGEATGSVGARVAVLVRGSEDTGSDYLSPRKLASQTKQSSFGAPCAAQVTSLVGAWASGVVGVVRSLG